MSNAYKEFLAREDGAITVDWVVLTAATVGLGLAAMAVVSGGVEDVAGDTSDHLTEIEITTAFATAVAAAGLTADTLTSWHHSPQWFEDVTTSYSDPGQWSQQALVAQHQAMANIILGANPGHIQSGHYHNAIDHMGALEIGMRAQGIEIPDTGITYQEAYDAHQATL